MNKLDSSEKELVRRRKASERLEKKYEDIRLRSKKQNYIVDDNKLVRGNFYNDEEIAAISQTILDIETYIKKKYDKIEKIINRIQDNKLSDVLLDVDDFISNTDLYIKREMFETKSSYEDRKDKIKKQVLKYVEIYDEVNILDLYKITNILNIKSYNTKINQ